MFITTHKIILRTNSNIGSRHRDIGITRDIRTGSVVDLVVSAGCDRKVRDISLSVIKKSIDIKRKYRLIGFVDLYRRIGPPKKGLGKGRPVEHPTLYLQLGLVRIQRKTRQSLCPEHDFNFIDPNDF